MRKEVVSILLIVLLFTSVVLTTTTNKVYGKDDDDRRHFPSEYDDDDDDDKAKVKLIFNKYELYATESVCIADEITFRPICKYLDTYGDEVTVNFYVH